MLARTLFVTMLSAMLLITACGGGGARSNQNVNSITKGQELIDLKRAYDEGIISQREYNTQKEQILDRD